MLNYSVLIYFSIVLYSFVEFCSLMLGNIYFYFYLLLICYTIIIGVEYNDALRLALCAGQYLDISTKSEYVDTIIAKCIDEYKGQRELQEADPTVRYGILQYFYGSLNVPVISVNPWFQVVIAGSIRVVQYYKERSLIVYPYVAVKCSGLECITKQ